VPTPSDDTQFAAPRYVGLALSGASHYAVMSAAGGS
jgi:hypothetical protein